MADQTGEAVDGFSWDDVARFVLDDVVPARCSECGFERQVEPDAQLYDCFECGAEESVTSPLIKLGLV